MKIRGNMILWSILHIIAGLLIWFIFKLTGLDYIWVLAIVLTPLFVYKIWFQKTHKYDEREIALMTKVFSQAGITIVVVLWAIHEHITGSFVPFLWGFYLFARGAFGLYYFTTK
ncbi:hypothetical protein CSA37_03360 [Candidatus Fermentibacteria bacterium]|nr:MAG: hypothetical protein CSA37_03360 [Candidatus Fermentibacteria bacterium]